MNQTSEVFKTSEVCSSSLPQKHVIKQVWLRSLKLRQVPGERLIEKASDMRRLISRPT